MKESRDNKMNKNIESMFARVESSSKSSSKFEQKLDLETRELLASFVSWLVEVDQKTSNTANSYKSYVAKSLAEPELELSSDQKSAIRAFKKFISS